MRVFPHGNVVNFEASVREMTAPELERLITDVLAVRPPVLTGILDMKKEAVYLYGTAESFRADEENGVVIVTARTAEGETHRETYPFDDLIISHEMHFDVVEGEEGEAFRYPVYYVTFGAGEKEEITLFFAGRDRVSEPLHYVVEYWSQAGESGRDAQFHPGSCSIPLDFKACLNNE
ncbi:hypothetical protein [Salinithrix halophila]|uniref:Uncharacterized protein n=1 Tax=Salinithrix halophila TaxID=1485204 RepID=A0ABV8JI53_9BACL